MNRSATHDRGTRKHTSLGLCLVSLVLLMLSTPAFGTPNPPLPPHIAVQRALNHVESTPDGLQLRHPQHVVDFAASGIQVQPRRGGPSWRWRLTHVSAEPIVPVAPHQASPTRIEYPRSGLIERYVLKAQSVEQQFLIPEPLPLDGAPLVVRGRITSAGTFRVVPEGWEWRSETGRVWLGPVRVLDTTGQELAATMTVSATETTITVASAVLANAVYPILIDPEIGTNDLRLSDMGPDGNNSFRVFDLQVVYNPTQNEYFVVWEGDDNTDFGNGPLADGEFEIWGQRVNAATGAEIGTDLRLSDMGPDGNASFDAGDLQVVYNPTQNEYFVVWEGDDNTDFSNGPLADGENEIWGQRVNAATGAEIGPDLRLSDLGPDGNASFDANDPQVVYNPTQNEYFVVWFGDDNTDFGNGALVAGEDEIWGQRVNAATGTEIGTDLRLSDLGPDGNASFDARDPQVVVNPTQNEYFVVWQGDDNTDFSNGPLANGEVEIWGQRVNAVTGAEIGSDLRLSDMGPDGDANFGAFNPQVVLNPTQNEYFVVWEGSDNTDFGNGPLADGENEIWGQRVNAATGAEIGTDLRLSDLGPDGNAAFNAFDLQVVYNPTQTEYFVIWAGDDNTDFGNGPLVNNEREIWGQRVNAATGAEIGTDLRLSDLGPDGNASFNAFDPQVVVNPTQNEYFVVWAGNDNTDFGDGPLANNEREIWGQRVNAATGAEIETDLRLSDLGPDGNASFEAARPQVVYNPTQTEYFVVWRGDDNTDFGNGALVDGEEEVWGQQVAFGVAFELGDAPDSAATPQYPTLLANNAAAHRGSGTLRLGSLWDSEADGQPTATADGDDLTDGADEDGVSFPGGGLPLGQLPELTVTGTAGGVLNAWVDFNQDGDWQDAGEQVLTDVATTGAAQALSVSIPAAAVLGTSFARFRLDSGGGLLPTGFAADGEVEDYQVTIVPSADLGITKTDGVMNAIAGDLLTYTIVVSNTGPSSVTDAVVTDTFPAALSCSWTSVAAGGASGNSNAAGDLSDTLNLPASSGVTYTVTCTIDAAATGTLSNTATIASAVSDPDMSTNSATDDDTVLSAQADLQLTKTDGVTSAIPGQQLTYTIVASNAGPSSVTDAVVTDPFPAGLSCSWTSVAAGGASGNSNTTGNLNDTLNLPVGGSVTYTVTCTIDAAATGTLSNTATIASAVSDPDMSTNSATDTDTVLTAQADLQLTKTDGVTSAIPGQQLTYTIVASNAGPSSVTDAVVTDPFPAGLSCSWTSVAAGGASGNSNTTGNLNDTLNLPVGGSVTYTVTCTIDAAATGTLSNTATISSVVADPTPDNDSATDNDTVLSAQADLQLTKSGPATAVAGSNVVYTLTVTNTGPSDAQNVQVTDPTPTGLSFVSNTGACTTAFPCDLGTVPNGANRVITTTFSLPANYTMPDPIENTATVSSSTPDPTPGNDSVTVQTPLGPPTVDLQLSKTNATSGLAVLDIPFTWFLTATNTGTTDAVFPAGTTLLTDTVPATATYSVHSLTNIINVTNAANLQCSLAGFVLTCTANGAAVTLGAQTGAFTVRLIATPSTTADLVNPSGGVCSIDPTNALAESDETNNSCQETVVVGPGTNAFGLTVQDENDGVPFQFVDISGTGSVVATAVASLAKATQTQTTVSLGGPGFNLFGSNVAQLAANTSGYLSTDLAGPATDTTNDCPLPMVPSDGGGARLYVLHDNLDTTVSHQYFATCPRPHDVIGFSPKGCNIFQWDGTYVSNGGAVSFQVVLYDEVSQLVYQYATVDQTGTDSTTGVQDASGTDGVLYRCNVPDSILPNESVVSFFHPAPVPVELQLFTIE